MVFVYFSKLANTHPLNKHNHMVMVITHKSYYVMDCLGPYVCRNLKRGTAHGKNTSLPLLMNMKAKSNNKLSHFPFYNRHLVD